ncbi:PQQ-binding-like beta-propeller repeat protein [bacterium]|nr:PQQ-binding-like beta-propeller repeat protein [bacterium]
MRPAAALTLFLFASAAVAQDWPAFRGPDGTGASRDAAPLKWDATRNVVWKTDLPGAGTSTPVVAGNRVFVTCYSGYNVPGRPAGRQEDLKLHVVALDRATGKVQWARDVTPKLPEQDTIRDGHGYASSTPAADATRLYTFFGKSGVVAFDHAGKELWRADVGSKLNGWGSGASVVLAGGKVIVNASVESDTLFGLDPATGAVAWRLPNVKEAWNTPAVATHNGRAELVMASFGKLFAVDPATGRELWHSATDIPWYMVPSPVVHDGVAYALGGRPGGGLAVRLGGSGNVTATHRLWTSKKGANVPSPVYHEGHLYWMHDNLGLAFCAEAKTGRVVYEERVGRGDGVYGSPVLAGGRIYYPGRSGTTYVVAAKPAFELLASNSFGERGDYLSSPAVAAGRLYLRTNRYVCCVGEK